MQSISCAELLSYVPDDLLETLEKQTNVNHQVKKLTGKVMFKLILFSLVTTNRVSLRVMEDFYNSEQFKVFSESTHVTRHSSIAERLMKVKGDFFRSIFEVLAKRFEKTVEGHKQITAIRKVDSTLVALSSKLLHIGMRGIAKHKADKSYIKYTITLHDALPSTVRICTKQREISEEVALRSAILDQAFDKKGSIVVFDRGLQRRKTLEKFTDTNIHFVTRLKSRLRYRRIKTHKQIQGRKSATLVFHDDCIVQLKDETEKFTSTEFRLIIASSRTTEETLLFLTNITDLSAREITDIYKKRWEIETFFKFIKQEFSFSHFVARNANGIEVMLYMTLIAAILISVYKSKNHIDSYKRAKLKFALELEMEVIKDIVILCGGDISLLPVTKRPSVSRLL